jgi:hypothetical protein
LRRQSRGARPIPSHSREQRSRIRCYKPLGSPHEHVHSCLRLLTSSIRTAGPSTRPWFFHRLRAPSQRIQTAPHRHVWAKRKVGYFKLARHLLGLLKRFRGLHIKPGASGVMEEASTSAVSLQSSTKRSRSDGSPTSPNTSTASISVPSSQTMGTEDGTPRVPAFLLQSKIGTYCG